MELLSFKEKKLLEQLDRMFGDHESSKDIKHAIFLSQTNRITDETIEQYKQKKEKDLELIRQQFTELNPQYAFDYPKETETIILSNNNIKDNVNSNELSRIEFSGDKDAVPINKE